MDGVSRPVRLGSAAAAASVSPDWRSFSAFWADLLNEEEDEESSSSSSEESPQLSLMIRRCFLALSSAFLSTESCFSARLTADLSACSCSSRCFSVASRISRAWPSEFRAPDTSVPLMIRFSTACWLASWACCWASSWRSGKSSIVASTCPAVTRSPTFTATEVTLPPLANPRFCSVIAVSEPVEVTPEVTAARVTRAVCGAFGSLLLQATSVIAMSAPTPAAAALRCTNGLNRGDGPEPSAGLGRKAERSRAVSLVIDGRDRATRHTPIPASGRRGGARSPERIDLNGRRNRGRPPM